MNFTEALVAIATVASVFWTGGLIVRQLNPSRVTNGLIHGMGFFIFASLSAVAALTFQGVWLVVVMFLFFCFYFYSYGKQLLAFQNQARGLIALPDWATNKDSYFSDTIQHLQFAGYLCVMFVPIMFWPQPFTVCVVGGLATYLGYQGVLGILNTVPAAAPPNAQLDLLKDEYKFKRDQTALGLLSAINEQLRHLT